MRPLPALLLVGAVAACGPPPAPPALATASPIPVETAVAVRRVVAEPLRVTGSVAAVRRVSPGTKLLGRVAAVLVDEGDTVAAGQLLARLESRDLQAAVAQARAAVAMAEAELENAGAQRERLSGLAARGSATAKALEDATAAHRVAAARLDAARADLDAAAATLAYAEVRTPIAGRVAARRIEPGDMASPGAPLFTVEDLSRVEIAAEVAESDIGRLAPGDPVHLEVLGGELEARVARIVPAGDSTSRTFTALLVAENPDGRLRSGMFARAVVPGPAREVLLVPANAVVARGQLSGVFVAGDDGRARLRWVEIGEAIGDDVEVRSGLADGERVVARPPAGLADGGAVELRGETRP